jgi:hypothetical protein
MGYNSNKAEKQNASKNKTALKRKRQLLFSKALHLPLASTLHSYVPTIIFK